MTTPRRIQLSRRKGWRMPPDTVKVDRTTKWGNPFHAGKHGDRAYCVEMFRRMCGGYLCISVDRACIDAQRAYPTSDLHELRGKNLACWCPLDGPCHADVLLRVANADPSSPSSDSGDAP